MLNGKLRILCVVVYRPPNQNKAFLSEFFELLSVVMSRYDRLLILGDFCDGISVEPVNSNVKKIQETRISYTEAFIGARSIKANGDTTIQVYTV